MLTLPCDNNMEIRIKVLQKFWNKGLGYIPTVASVSHE